jgi:hypothetical protein
MILAAILETLSSWHPVAESGPRCRRPFRPALLATPALAVLVLVAVPREAGAQSLGTMQVTARVLPARAGWSALSVARDLATRMEGASAGQSLSTRTGVVRAVGVVTGPAGRRRLLITLHHLYN